MSIKGIKKSEASRLAARTVTALDGCLLWTGALSTQGGYGCFQRTDGQMDYCHRVAWELANDMAIPDGYQIHHVCRTRICCNHDHLILVTRTRHLELEAEEKAERHAMLRPQIRNLNGMGRTAKEIKVLTGATLTYIAGLLKSDAKLLKTALSMPAAVAA